MEIMDLLLFIKNTYGLTIALKNNITCAKLEKREMTGISALVDTLEQNLYNINIEVEELINLH